MAPIRRSLSLGGLLCLAVLCDSANGFSSAVSVPNNATQCARYDIPGPRPARAAETVFFQYFEGHSGVSGVNLNWAVYTEKDVEGFRVYRRSDKDCCYSVVNDEGMIAAWRSSYNDDKAQNGRIYQYALSVVLSKDVEVLSTPIEVRTPEASQSAPVAGTGRNR
jgi:hypothetical protein